MHEIYNESSISLPVDTSADVGTSLSMRASLLWPALISLLTVPAIIYLYCDFQEFLALGPGGTPSTVPGYLRVKLLGLLAISEPYKSDSGSSESSRGLLRSLPDRGYRPVTRGIAPHRQMTQRASPELYQKLADSLNELGKSTPSLQVGISCFEKHSTALFSTSPIKVTCEGEICHVHPSDGSMHLTVHPADAKVILDSRWGERHPLARGDGLAYSLSKTFLMIYAPRGEADIQILLQIVKAAAWYIGGGDLSNAEPSHEVTSEAA